MTTKQQPAMLSEQDVLHITDLSASDLTWFKDTFPNEMAVLQTPDGYRREVVNFVRNITGMRKQGASPAQITDLFGLGRRYAPARATVDGQSTNPGLLADVHYQNRGAAEVIAASLTDYWASECSDKQMPVFVHVGAPSSTGDSLGPFVGWFLKRKGFQGEYLGDLAEPVHARNLKEKINEAWLVAMRRNKFPHIIAVDAAIGIPGRITVNRGPLRPGAGMGKNLPLVGSVHIMGGTSHFPFMMWFAGLDQIVEMAEVIADGLMKFHKRWGSKRNSEVTDDCDDARGDAPRRARDDSGRPGTGRKGGRKE